MADVIYLGGGPAPAQSGGSWGFLKDLIPIGALLLVAYLAYSYFVGGTSTAGDTTSTGTGSGGTLVDFLTGKTDTSTPTTTQKTGTVGDSTLSQLITPKSSTAAAAAIAAAQAINVQGGMATPITYWPGGEDVVSFSDAVSSASVAQTDYTIEHGIASKSITGAWWDPGPAATYANEDLAAISGQSNIPAGVHHCSCNAALVASGVCGPADSWYLC